MKNGPREMSLGKNEILINVFNWNDQHDTCIWLAWIEGFINIKSLLAGRICPIC